MRSRICIFFMMHIATIVAQEFQITAFSEPNLIGTSTVLNVTGCLHPYLQYRGLGMFKSINVSNACAIFYNNDHGDCSSEEFSILPPNDPAALDLGEPFDHFAKGSVSRCNYCPTKFKIGIQTYSFVVSDHEAVSGHHWFFNTAEFDNFLNQTNICGQILDEFPIPFINVVSGCVQFYSSNDCTTTEPEINKFQSIHGVREWNVQKPIKSFSHCFFHCLPKLKRTYVGVRGRYVEEEEPAFNGIRITLSSGLRENVYENILNVTRCQNAISNVTRVVAKDTCIVLYANANCNSNRIVYKPTVLEAMGEKIAAVSVPDVYRKLPHVKSFTLCKILAQFEDYHLVLGKTRFFKDHATSDTIMLFGERHFEGNGQILNISGCSALPHPLTRESSIDSHGKCLLLFAEKNCTGHYEKLEIGSLVLQYLGFIHSIESYQSIQLCSSKAQLSTEVVDLGYNFTIKQYETKGYNWTFSSLANQSDICWEIPYYYRSTSFQGAVINNGCLKVFMGLKCNPFSLHLTLSSSINTGHLLQWELKSRRGEGVGVELMSFTSCADLKHPRIQSSVPKESINFPYNYPNGTFFITTTGQIEEKMHVNNCTLIPHDFSSKPSIQPVGELSVIYAKNRCIYVFDQQDCTMSETTTLPIKLNTTDGHLEMNLTEKPLWGKPFSVVSVIECDNFTDEYKELERLYKIELEHRSATNSTESSTTSPAIYISLSATFGILFVIGLGIGIYFKVKTTRKNKLSNVELDVFYNGSDEPTTSNEDAIQNTALNKAFEIPPTNFAYVKSDDGTPVVLGSGCFGKVIRGILHTGFDELNNCQLTKNVAIKIPKIGITLEQIRSLLCEIKICAFVGKHKNIVEFIGFCIKDIDLGKVSILLDLCENGSLLQFLRDHAKDFQKNCKIENIEQHSTELKLGCHENHYSNNEAFDYSRLLRWCQEIAEGMEFLSSKHVLHADLATRNCLLDSDLQIKITDFGLSRKLYDYGNYVKTSKAMLPWRWMALESLKHFTFSVKSDVWSYGVCLWEIFSFGDTPYPTQTFDEDFINYLSTGLRLSKTELCPEYCYQLMLQCWDEDPSKRNDFLELRKAIDDFRREAFPNNVVDDDHIGLYTVLE